MQNNFKPGDKARFKPGYDDGFGNNEDFIVAAYYLVTNEVERASDHVRIPCNWIYMVNEQQGKKFDDNKPPVGLIFESFPRALIEVAKVAGFGTKRYGRGNCFLVEDAKNRYNDAKARHAISQFIDGDLDPDSGLYHLAHEVWNGLFLLETKLREKND